ncbi:hypothetical protein GDO86_001090 [Hymenochirus boettgeri]|uniref:Uncharacterized protein n=1 Tax=Hymenochirus boettgeri TaxID=247094 RepID=A0A8T2KK30_9PIPI|nr:hypothetical protein GDO86_001090 [Hymenochirus boettgeri]
MTALQKDAGNTAKNLKFCQNSKEIKFILVYSVFRPLIHSAFCSTYSQKYIRRKVYYWRRLIKLCLISPEITRDIDFQQLIVMMIFFLGEKYISTFFKR